MDVSVSVYIVTFESNFDDGLKPFAHPSSQHRSTNRTDVEANVEAVCAGLYNDKKITH